MKSVLMVSMVRECAGDVHVLCAAGLRSARRRAGVISAAAAPENGARAAAVLHACGHQPEPVQAAAYVLLNFRTWN